MPTEAMAGQFVISLDFELHWGIRDHTPLSECTSRLMGARRAVDALLHLFDCRGIHATWATVGILFTRGRADAMAAAPALRPGYAVPGLDPYPAIEAAGDTENADPYHFAASLVERIARTRGQELATHTFGHFYCLEPGSSVEAFEADLGAARALGRRFDTSLTSLVFPRNQYSQAHLEAARRAGIKAYRGNPDAWFWSPGSGDAETRLKRVLRFSDAYWPVGGRQSQRASRDGAGLVNVPATAFLRPYSPATHLAESLRLRRLTGSMTAAAMAGGLFHLWWHPHNFALYLDENLSFLNRVLDHFELLQRRYAMASLSMSEAALIAPAA